MACQKTWGACSRNTATPLHMPCNPGMTEYPVQTPQRRARPGEFATCQETCPSWAPTATATALATAALSPCSWCRPPTHTLIAPRSRAPRQGQASLTVDLEVRGGEPCTSSQKTDLTHAGSASTLRSHLLGGLSLQPLPFLDPVLGVAPSPNLSLLGRHLHKLRPLFC